LIFDWIIAAEDVAHGKSELDVFLEAARRAGMRGIDIRPFYSPQR
jgi:hypothetical protein